MRVINKTSKKTLAKSAQICSSSISQAKGLMFSKPLKDKCLIFVFKKPRIVMLHMLFVFFSIDILFLDTSKRVIELRQDVRPFTLMIKSRKRVKYIIELPRGTIRRTKTKLNDLTQF